MYHTFRLHKIRQFIMSNSECGFNMTFERLFAYPCTCVYAISVLYLIFILIFHIACKMFVPGVYQNMHSDIHTHIQQRVSLRKIIIHRKHRVITTYDVKTYANKEF